MEKYLVEVHNSLIRENSLRKDENDLLRANLRVPAVRKHLKNTHFTFLEESNQKILNSWDFIWKNSECFEVMSSALYFYQGKSLSKSEFQKLKTWVNRISCWEHSDDLSKIYATVVEDNPEWIIPSLKNWNKSKNSWKRRQSVVSLIEYARKRKRVLPFNDLISFVEPLLQDKEYYVQKGLGWTIREIYNVYPKETLGFIKKNLQKISPIAYSAAIEKLDIKLKKNLNEERKELRKNKC